MKKLLGILVLGLLWYNFGIAGEDGRELKTTKNFDVMQWGIDISKAPPGMEKVTASWKLTTVQGFQIGNQPWKTAQGKNIQHAGIGTEVFPEFISEFLDQFGPQKFQGNRIGDIKGTFSEGIVKEDLQLSHLYI